MLFLLKLTLAPALVVAVTLAGRRWGPRVAGWLGGLPVIVGPILLAVAIEHGSAFAARAAAGALLGLLALCAFVLAYAWTARRTWWLPAVGAGWAATAAATAALDSWTPPPGLALAVVALGFVVTTLALPRAEPGARTPPPRWDLAMRAGATAAIVLVLTGLAGVLGAHLAGLLAAFPVLASVLAAFTHAQDGPEAAAGLLGGMVRGLGSFAAFCFVVTVAVEEGGVAATFLVAAAVALISHALLGAVRSPAPAGSRP